MLWEESEKAAVVNNRTQGTYLPACLELPVLSYDQQIPTIPRNHPYCMFQVQECVLYVTSGKLIPWQLIWGQLISWKKAILYVPLQFVLITTWTLLIYFVYESDAADLQVNIMFTAVSKISLRITFSSAFSGNSLETNSGSCAIHTNSHVTWNKSRVCQQLASLPAYHTPSFRCSIKAECVVG